MELLQENKDSLISVLEAFIHDPLVEWQEQKRREVRLGAMCVPRRLLTLIRC